MSKIIIQLQGGLVQDIFIQGEDIGIPTEAIVVNEDVEGADRDEITSVKIKNGTSRACGTYKACIHTYPINTLPKNSDVDRIVKRYLK